MCINLKFENFFLLIYFILAVRSRPFDQDQTRRVKLAVDNKSCHNESLPSIERPSSNNKVIKTIEKNIRGKSEDDLVLVSRPNIICNTNIINEERLYNNLNRPKFEQCIIERQKLLSSSILPHTETNILAFSPLTSTHSLIYPLPQSVDVNLLNINDQSLETMISEVI